MITVHRYGVHYRWAPPDALTAQLRLAHDLREDLVTLQHDHEQAVRDIWSSYPAVAAAEDALARAGAAVEAATEQVNAQRQAARTKKITGPAAETLRTARATARAARQARRDAITAVRSDATARLGTAAAALRAAQKALYARYCQDGDLYWACYNAVLDDHRVATHRIQADRAQGRPAQLRHHRFDGSGTITVQLQRQAGMPPRTPAMIANTESGRWRSVLTLPWVDPAEWEQMTRAERRHAGRLTLRMRCGPGHVDVPVQVHRMLPADADITGAQLTVRRVAGGIRAHVTITAKLPDPAPVTDGPTVAVHLGWLDEGDGIRVATWRSTEPLDVPPDLRPVLRVDPGRRTGTMVIPARVADRLAAADAIRSDRDTRLDRLRADMVAWLTAHGPVPHPTRAGEDVTAAAVARWRSPARFAVLARAWRAAPPPGGQVMAADLEAWRAADRADWERQEHGRAKVLAHRDDLHRQVAAVIAGQAGRLVVDDMAVAELARRAGSADERQLPEDVERRIARQRAAAAPGGLRAAVVAASTRDGVPVVTVSAAGLTRVHARCGHENPADDRYLSRPVACDGCGARYDPDASATVLMLARAVTPPGAPTETARVAS